MIELLDTLFLDLFSLIFVRDKFVRFRRATENPEVLSEDQGATDSIVLQK